MKAKKISITSDALNELFRYDEESGKLFWKIKPSRKINIGAEAGCLHSSGYREVKVHFATYKVHRIIWLMVYGEIREDMEIDHRDGVRDNNKLNNLRLITGQQNQWNRTKAKGFHWDKRTKKWRAQISVDGRLIHLGSFTDEQDASNAYLVAKERWHQII